MLLFSFVCQHVAAVVILGIDTVGWFVSWLLVWLVGWLVWLFGWLFGFSVV
jgi:hypothetical protein